MRKLPAILQWVDRSIAQPIAKGALLPLPLLGLIGLGLGDFNGTREICWVLAGAWAFFVFWRLAMYMRVAMRIEKGSPEAKRFCRGEWHD